MGETPRPRKVSSGVYLKARETKLNKRILALTSVCTSFSGGKQHRYCKIVLWQEEAAKESSLGIHRLLLLSVFPIADVALAAELQAT